MNNGSVSISCIRWDPGLVSGLTFPSLPFFVPTHRNIEEEKDQSGLEGFLFVFEIKYKVIVCLGSGPSQTGRST